MQRVQRRRKKPETINGVFNSSVVCHDQPAITSSSSSNNIQQHHHLTTTQYCSSSKKTDELSLFYIYGGTPYQCRVIKDCLFDLISFTTVAQPVIEGSLPLKEFADQYLDVKELFDFLAFSNKQCSSTLQVWCFKKIYLKTLDHLVATATYIKKEGITSGSVYIDPVTQKIFVPEDQKIKVVLE